MASLLTVAAVEARTGVTLTQDELDTYEARALPLVETVLNRPVAEETRTEALRSRHDGWAYVNGHVTAAEDPDGIALVFEPHRIWFGYRNALAELTYTVGWTADTAPQPILDALALGVVRMRQTDQQAAAQDAALSLPTTAQRVRVGDIEIDRGAVPKTVGADGGVIPSGFEAAAPLGSEACWLLAPFRRSRPS